MPRARATRGNHRDMDRDAGTMPPIAHRQVGTAPRSLRLRGRASKAIPGSSRLHFCANAGGPRTPELWAVYASGKPGA